MRLDRIVALFALLVAAPLVAHAQPSVPEIDPGSVVGALTLLTGSVLVLTGRPHRK